MMATLPPAAGNDGSGVEVAALRWCCKSASLVAEMEGGAE